MVQVTRQVFGLIRILCIAKTQRNARQRTAP